MLVTPSARESTVDMPVVSILLRTVSDPPLMIPTPRKKISSSFPKSRLSIEKYPLRQHQLASHETSSDRMSLHSLVLQKLRRRPEDRLRRFCKKSCSLKAPHQIRGAHISRPVSILRATRFSAHNPNGLSQWKIMARPIRSGRSQPSCRQSSMSVQNRGLWISSRRRSSQPVPSNRACC